MEQKQDEAGTTEKIGKIWQRWAESNTRRFDAKYAMGRIGAVLAEAAKREHRLRTISEDARRDRELTSRMHGGDLIE